MSENIHITAIGEKRSGIQWVYIRKQNHDTVAANEADMSGQNKISERRQERA